MADREKMTGEQRQARIDEVKAELKDLRSKMPMCSGANATKTEFRITELEDELLELRESQS